METAIVHIEIALTFFGKKGKLRFMNSKHHIAELFPAYQVLDQDAINKEIIANEMVNTS